METNLTLKFKGKEAELLEELINQGLFSSKSEAIRAALMHYFLELGLLGKEQQWKDIRSFNRRDVSPDQLAKDIQVIKRNLK